MEKFVRIGVGILIRKEGKILFGKRKNSHGDGTWSFPGGHLEFGESVENCAKREVAEETAITITNIREICFTEDLFTKENKHYITIFVEADYVSGEPQVLEPQKCEQWQWFSPNNLPKDLFLPNQNFIKKISLKNDLMQNSELFNIKELNI